MFIWGWITDMQGRCIVSHGAQIGVFRFLPTIYANTNAKQMRPRSLCAVWCFLHVFLHVQTAVDVGGIHTWELQLFWLFWPPIWANLGISHDTLGGQYAGPSIWLCSIFFFITELKVGDTDCQSKWNKNMKGVLRGHCTPNQKLACFVLYLTIINTFFE